MTRIFTAMCFVIALIGAGCGQERPSGTLTLTYTALHSATVSTPGPASTAASTRVDPTSLRVRAAAEGPPGAIIVSPDGSAHGDGSSAHPLDLKTALSQKSLARPGGVVLLRGGTYNGEYVSELGGTTDRPIVVRSETGARAIIMGRTKGVATLTVRGQATWIRDLEITRAATARTTSHSASQPNDITLDDGVDVFGSDIKLIDLVVHDNSNGLGLWRAATNTEVSGCIIFDNGWTGPDRGHGHGIYVENLEGTKHISNVVIFNNFGYGVHAYSATDDWGRDVHIHMDEITSFENGAPSGRHFPNIFVGTEKNPADDIEVARSIVYHRGASGDNITMGMTAKDNGSVSVHDNQIIGGSRLLALKEWKNVDVQRNWFTSRVAPGEYDASMVDLQPPASDSVDLSQVQGSTAYGYAWDSNHYRNLGLRGHAPANQPYVVTTGTNGSSSQHMNFNDWRNNTRYDRSSVYQEQSPANTEVFLRRDAYQSGRAHIMVLNWTGRQSVPVDLSQAGLKPNTAYEIRDVQSLFGSPVASGVYLGGTVDVPLTETAASQPTGAPQSAVKHTPLEFGTFLLVPK